MPEKYPLELLVNCRRVDSTHELATLFHTIQMFDLEAEIIGERTQRRRSLLMSSQGGASVFPNINSLKMTLQAPVSSKSFELISAETHSVNFNVCGLVLQQMFVCLRSTLTE